MRFSLEGELHCMHFFCVAIDTEAEGQQLSQSRKTGPQPVAHESSLIYIFYETTLTLCGCQHK